jgi:hypothetical protein
MTRRRLNTLKVAFGRFEALHPNELWVGDAIHGPVIGRHKAILFAFLDNHSRLSHLVSVGGGRGCGAGLKRPCAAACVAAGHRGRLPANAHARRPAIRNTRALTT